MDDDVDDYELFLNTILAHFKLISKFVINFNWTPLVCFGHSVQLYVMRPQTFIAVSLIILLALLAHTCEYWLKIIARKTIKCIKRLHVTFGINFAYLTAIIPNVDANRDDHNEQYLSASNVGIYALQGRRPKMEDRFNYYNNSDRIGFEFWAVYDGHGGESAANFVGTHLYSAIKSRVKQLHSNNILSENGYCQRTTIDSPINGGDKSAGTVCAKSSDTTIFTQKVGLSVSSLSQIVTEELLSVDKQLIEEAKKNYDVAGTTALIALKLIVQNKLIVANVGDSRGVICDAKGSAIPLSFDHKPQQDKERKRIKEAGGFIKFNGVWRVAGILATSRALGDYPLKDRNFVIAEPDILTFDLNDIQPKFMILASDGLWDTFTNEEAVNFVKEDIIKLKQYSTEIAFDASKNLVMEAYHRGSLDNISVIIVLFDIESPSQS